MNVLTESRAMLHVFRVIRIILMKIGREADSILDSGVKWEKKDQPGIVYEWILWTRAE
jgi:hypothetical protein